MFLLDVLAALVGSVVTVCLAVAILRPEGF